MLGARVGAGQWWSFVLPSIAFDAAPSTPPSQQKVDDCEADPARARLTGAAALACAKPNVSAITPTCLKVVMVSLRFRVDSLATTLSKRFIAHANRPQGRARDSKYPIDRRAFTPPDAVEAAG